MIVMSYGWEGNRRASSLYRPVDD